MMTKTFQNPERLAAGFGTVNSLIAPAEIERDKNDRLRLKSRNERAYMGDMQLRWLLFVLALAFTTPASSQGRDVQCHPTWATPDLPITENTFRYWSRARNEPVEIGPRLDAEMYSWNRGALFQLQYGYFNPWFLSQTGEQTDFPNVDEFISNLATSSSSTGYDPSTGLFNPSLLDGEDVRSPTISFWMPSLRYVEQNMRTAYNFRPCEPGREPPEEDQYVVQFRIEWPGTENIEQSPQIQRFENAQLRPLSTPNFFQLFEDEYYVNLRCALDRGCNGWIWERERNYILYMRFPESLRHENPDGFWLAPTDAAITLLEGWKMNEDIRVRID
ncbi:hypothetical protein [Boseongicola sp. H5]|uniref:hypothetical protein n=1 Tax=Boseongicola sp. H5 TaxID=2763261 RepID=UPI001D0BC6B3|nr:hypothetical protein [Boseongicola sp. H5]